MDRFEAARDRYADIVGAMRDAGMFEVARPPPDAFESREAFLADRMSFEQWLRYVMLPNLERCIDRRAALPGSSALAQRARREYEHFATVSQAGPLIAALAQRDAFIVLLAARACSLRFFEAGRQLPPREKRHYAKSFPSQETRFVYWELSLAHPPLGAATVLEIEEHWSAAAMADPVVQRRHETIEADWRDSWHCHSYGWDEPGHWAPGRHQLNLRRWDEPLAEGVFVITPRP